MTHSNYNTTSKADQILYYGIHVLAAIFIIVGITTEGISVPSVLGIFAGLTLLFIFNLKNEDAPGLVRAYLAIPAWWCIYLAQGYI